MVYKTATFVEAFYIPDFDSYLVSWKCKKKQVLINTYATKQGSRASWLAQMGFAAFGKGVQLISGSPYAGTEQLPQLDLVCGFLATLFVKSA